MPRPDATLRSRWARAAVQAAVVCVVGAALWTTNMGAAAPRRQPVRLPYGEMNLAWSNPGMIGIVGWAKDPDVDRPIDVVVAVDDRLYRYTAGVYNPFLPGSWSQKFRSYVIAIPTTPGEHRMCIAALNVGAGAPFRLLGCGRLVVRSADPGGNVDAATAVADDEAVTVTGWAADPERSGPIDVSLSIDGTPVATSTANGQRPDLAGVLPGGGTAHGFSLTAPASPGAHTVCVTARNVGLGADSTIGCRSVTVRSVQPIGHLDTVRVGVDHVTASGWAVDPDSTGGLSVTVTARRRGHADDGLSRTTTSWGDRPDVAAATGMSRSAGFTVDVGLVEPGTYDVCGRAHNVGRGRDVDFGCQVVGVADHRPEVAVTSVSVPSPGSARIAGRASDPDATGTTPVQILVDGALWSSVPASASAPHGFSATVTGLSDGFHSLCVVVPDRGTPSVGINGAATPPCASVVIGPGGLATTGAISTPRPVESAIGSLHDVDRDGGIAVSMRDGSTLWFFGDAVAPATDGTPRYFVNSSAAWAPAGSPLHTQDATDSSGHPIRLADPTTEFPDCPAARPTKGFWVTSAVRVPAGGLDHVIVTMGNVCIGADASFEARGTSTAEWYYDPTNPPSGRGIKLTVTNPLIGDAPWGTTDRPGGFGNTNTLHRGYGNGAVVGTDGLLYLYACDRPDDLWDIAAFGPCHVARVEPDFVASPSAYRFWSGSGWSPDQNAAIGMVMPQGANWITRYPAASASYTYDHFRHRYVMAYNPWPGFVDRIMLRTSTTPQGPWSPPVEIMLPDCNDRVDGVVKGCYAATLHPELSNATELGLGWYDMASTFNERRGRYVTATVPLTVSP
ncbi:MAG: DUF4185 domain-containing protein [Microthrixaceae bacterium]